MDHLVLENEGGRKLVNQIVRQVFRPRGNKEEKWPKNEYFSSPHSRVN